MIKEKNNVACYKPVTITLQATKIFEGTTYTTLTMRKPTTDDLILSTNEGASPLESDKHLYAGLTSVPPEFIGELDWYDYMQLDMAFKLFTSPVSTFAAKCALVFPVQPVVSA